MSVVLAAALLLLGVACGESRDAAESGMPIDPAKARVFLAFQEKMLGFAQKMLERSARLEERPQKDSKDTVGDEAQELDALREELGLSEAEVSGLSEIAAGVLARGAGTPLVAQIAELEQSLAGLPAEQRREAEKGLAEMREMKESIVDLKDARARYGDAVVDAMLALEPELRSQYDLLVSVGSAQR